MFEMTMMLDLAFTSSIQNQRRQGYGKQACLRASKEYECMLRLSVVVMSSIKSSFLISTVAKRFQGYPN